MSCDEYMFYIFNLTTFIYFIEVLFTSELFFIFFYIKM